MAIVAVIFWCSAGLLIYAQLGYPLLVGLLNGLMRGARPLPADKSFEPTVSLIVTCHNEERVIEAKLRNALELDYAATKLEVIVAIDGSTDRTAEIATKIAASERRVKVLDLPRAGKVATQGKAVATATGELVLFSDANASWRSDAVRKLVAAFADERVGYVCGEVRFLDGGGGNQEGVYWHYETRLRRAESRLHSITAGNGAIYATRRSSYIDVDPRMGHDLSLPFNYVRRGLRAIVVPAARATEKMVPDVEGEFRRKRRMMSHTWLIVLRGGMLDPRGYGALYALEILSHRLLRYSSPLLHLTALVTNVALLGYGTLYTVTLATQVAVLLLALGGLLSRSRHRLLAIPYYYLSMTGSIALGLWDYLRHGVPATWTPVKEAR